MKTNAIISALCVVGIIGAFANDGALIQRGRTDGPPEEPVVPGAIPIQKVVYWSDIPGMKWNWTTQVTNKPSIPTVGTLNTTATTTQTTSASESFSGNITLHKIAKTGAFADMTGNKLTLGNIESVGLSLDRLGNVQLRDDKYNGDGNLHTITFPINKDGTLALNEDVSVIIPAWVRNSAVSYTAGDLVRYNNKLYKAKQNIAANQAWNANNWEEVTIAAEFRSKADTSWVNNHKWDWGTQVTNSPFALHTTGFPYVEVPIGFAVTDSGYGYAIPSSASFAGAKVHGIESLGVGDGIITNCYGGIGLGMAFNVTNDVAFVWSGRSYDAAIKYGSHGMSTFNVDPHDGPAGFWIGETNLATYLANAGSGEHTHSNLVNGTSKLRLSPDGVVSVGTDQSALGNPVITIHAGSVFSADTAAHGKTFSTDLVLDYTYIDGVSGPLLIQTNGWTFVAPAEGSSTLWCGPSDWPSYAFDLNNYNSESSTATLSSTDSDPSCSFSGTITITRPRGKVIPTIDHVLPGETILRNGYNDFETKGFVNYAFKGPYPYSTTILTLSMGEIEFFGSSVGIINPSVSGESIGYMWGIGQFWKNGYHYSLPYTDNNGSGNYTLATTSMTNGLASTSWVNNTLSGKMNKQTGDIADDIAVFDGNGNAVDSGVNLTTMVNNFNRYSLTNHVHDSITTYEPHTAADSGATLTLSRDGELTVVCKPMLIPGQETPQTWTNTLAFANHTHSNLVNGTTQVIANQNGTASISAILPPTYSVSLQNQVDGSTWNWNIVFLGYMMVGGEKTEIDLDDMIATHENLSRLTDIRVSITQQETGAVVAQEQTITLVPYAENSWQFGNNLVLEQAFSSMQTHFTSMGAPFSIAYLETTGGESPYNYTFGSQFGPLSGSTGMFLSGGGPSLKTIATVDQIPSVPALATVATSGSYNDLLNKPTNVSVFNNDAGYVKTNTVGSLVLGPPTANQASGFYTIVAGTGGAINESDNSIIIGPGSHIYQNSEHSGIFGPGGSIKAGSPYSFVFGASTVEASCPNSFVIGGSATSTNKYTFLWTADSTGNKTLPAAKTTHGDGTFNINTLDGVAGVYIGDTNLQQIIRLEAKAMIHDAVSQVNVNLQSAEDTRVALTNLITILKNL